MPRRKRSPAPSKSGLDRAKALPWALLLQAGFAVGRRAGKLSSSERERLLGLVRESGGRLGRLSEKERKELRKLAGKLDLRGIGDDLVPLIRRARRGRR